MPKASLRMVQARSLSSEECWLEVPLTAGTDERTIDAQTASIGT
jgi:hypothetical protein